MKKKHLLLGCRGCGSAIVEAAFEVAGLPLDYEEVDYGFGSSTRSRLLEVNPLGQVPALVLPQGGLLTESLAIVQYVDDLAPQAGLVPKAPDGSRSAFLRWSAFLVAALYPTWTYGRMSAIGLYIAVMTHWRPGRKWFAANTPRLDAIAERTSATAGVADVIARNFS